MKKIRKTTPVTLGTAILVLAFALLVVAFPVQAHAYYYGPNSCVASNGYWYTNCPSNLLPTPQPYPYPVPVPVPVPQYPVLSASCYAVNTSASVGTSVQWSVYATGGTGSYSYNWSGTDGVSGSGQVVNMVYYVPGTKTAAVVIFSGNQTLNLQCSNSVNVYGTYYPQTYNYPYNYNVYQPVVQQYVQPVYASNNAGLDIGCYADPVTASANQPVTWSAEVTGGLAPYTYAWSGSDSLSGNQSSVTKYYSTSGEKSAIVSVTSADGKTGTRACSNALAVRSATPTRVAVAPTAPIQAPAQPSNNLSAASLFSLSNVPWGWVAILVILVLFGTVMYLVVNRPKI